MAGYLQGSGFLALTFGPLKIDYGPKGTTTHFTVTCLTIGPLIAYYNYIVQFGASGTFLGCDVGLDGSTGAEVKSLEVSVPGLLNNLQSVLSELYFDLWELLTNEPTDSIFNNPLIVGAAGWMTDNDKVILSSVAINGFALDEALADANKRCNDTPQSLSYPASGGTGDSPSQYQSPSDSRSKQIYIEIMKGQTEFERPAYVLRHTSYCSAGALYNTSTANTGKIYTPAQLLTEVGSGWTYNLPPRLYSKIAGIPFQLAPTTEAGYYEWGWKKTISREPVMANFMVECETEYALNLWSTLRYEPR
jgi:hypothetical protein